MLLEERQHPVIEHVGCRDRVLAVVELGKGEGVTRHRGDTEITHLIPTRREETKRLARRPGRLLPSRNLAPRPGLEP